LITLEPKSSVILSIELSNDRKKVTWSEHITKIVSAGNIEIIKMATDNGVEYLDHSKNQINHEFLNLFAFYHNHR